MHICIYIYVTFSVIKLRECLVVLTWVIVNGGLVFPKKYFTTDSSLDYRRCSRFSIVIQRLTCIIVVTGIRKV